MYLFDLFLTYLQGLRLGHRSCCGATVAGGSANLNESFAQGLTTFIGEEGFAVQILSGSKPERTVLGIPF
jgi:hypothetical protein